MENSIRIEDNYLSQFPDRLKQRIKDCGYKSGAQFASAVGISEQTLSGWMHGKTPDFNTLIEVCLCLDCSVDFITGHDAFSTHDLKGVCNYTGLSESAARNLHDNKAYKGTLVSAIVNNDPLLSLFFQFLGIAENDLYLERVYDKWDIDGNVYPEVDYVPTASEQLSINGVEVTKELLIQSVLSLLRNNLEHVLPEELKKILDEMERTEKQMPEEDYSLPFK